MSGLGSESRGGNESRQRSRSSEDNETHRLRAGDGGITIGMASSETC